MGIAKEESEKAFVKSKYSCFRCGEKILLNVAINVSVYNRKESDFSNS